ncbi:MAG: hypothetical protein AB2710_19980 [Candidatus Thiodiazotropha sp.]
MKLLNIAEPYTESVDFLGRHVNNVDSYSGDAEVVYADTIDSYPALREGVIAMKPVTQGPEIELVFDFLKQGLPAAPKGQVRTVFLEPKLDTGYPDIVVAYWDKAVTEAWPSVRRELTKVDLKVFQYILQADSYVPLSEICLMFGRNQSIRQSIKRMMIARIVDLSEDEQAVIARPVREIFAIRRLISIEAKMSNWRSAYRQAFHNLWFSSESYLLLNTHPKSTELYQTLNRTGLGLIGRGDTLSVASVKANIENIPKSFASWQFNEWAWRSTLK